MWHGDHQNARIPEPAGVQPKTELGRRLQKNARWLYYNGGRYWNGYKSRTQYNLAVLFSSFLMGEIAAATIFKQMSQSCEELVFTEAFKNIGRDEGRHMAICLSPMERDYPKLSRKRSRSSPSRSAQATCSCLPCCSSRRPSSGIYLKTSSLPSVKRKPLHVKPASVSRPTKTSAKTGATPCST